MKETHLFASKRPSFTKREFLSSYLNKTNLRIPKECIINKLSNDDKTSLT